MDCLFCKIVNKEIPADIVFENDNVLAFKDIHPKTPVHILIIPKKHVASMNDFEAGDKETLGNMLLAAKQIAQDLQIAEKGYKLLIRTGEDGGQEVGHVHMHLLGGAKLYEEIRME